MKSYCWFRVVFFCLARHAHMEYLALELRLGLWKGYCHIFCVALWTSKSTIQMMKRSSIPSWKGAQSWKSCAFLSFHDDGHTAFLENSAHLNPTVFPYKLYSFLQSYLLEQQWKISSMVAQFWHNSNVGCVLKHSGFIFLWTVHLKEDRGGLLHVELIL